MKEDTLTSFYADRFAMAQCFVIKGCRSIHNFEAVIRRWPLSQILHADEFRIPLMHGNKNLLVIFAGIVFRFDVEESKLSRIQATTQIFTGKGVSVIPAGSHSAGQ